MRLNEPTTLAPASGFVRAVLPAIIVLCKVIALPDSPPPFPDGAVLAVIVEDVMETPPAPIRRPPPVEPPPRVLPEMVVLVIVFGPLSSQIPPPRPPADVFPLTVELDRFKKFGDPPKTSIPPPPI